VVGGRRQVAGPGWSCLGVAGLVLLAAGCGSSGSTPPRSAAPASSATSSAPAASLRLSVSPSTGLIGGQRLQVSLTGFPPGATVMVYECAGIPPAGSQPGCGAAASLTFYTATTGDASGVFVAQPAAGTEPNGTPTQCRQQCVLIGLVIKLGGGVAPNPASRVTAALSFASTAPGLADASLTDLSWVSASDGWALAAQPCATGTCARLAHTSDGGSHWTALPDPPAHLQDGTVDCATAVCVSGVRFANPSVGYLFGPALLMTTNGGRSWQPQPGPQIETLTVGAGRVYRVAYTQSGCPGPCQPSLQDAAIGSTAWHPIIGQLAAPGRSDSAQIVTAGSTLLLALYGSQAGPVSAQATVYRSTDAGGSWQRQPDPCSGGGGAKGQEEDLTDLAAAQGGFFAGLCSPHTGNGTFVVTSTDAGGSWQRAGTLPNIQPLALLAAASPTTLAVATGPVSGGGTLTAQLLLSTDAGGHWNAAATDTQQLTQTTTSAWLGFETSQVGRWIGDPHSIWTTHDGGQHWLRTAFH